MNSIKILIVRRDNIGDLVCTTPAISALRKHYPNAEIAALVNSYNAEVLRGNPDLDKTFVYSKLKHIGSFRGRIKAIYERLKLIVEIRRWKPSVTILAKANYDRHGHNFARMIGSKNIIGYGVDEKCSKKQILDYSINAENCSEMHEVQCINLLLKPLGIQDALGHLKIYPELSVVSKLRENIPESSKRVALHISAREPERRWGEENIIKLARYILESEPESQIMLLWSPGKTDDSFHPGDDIVAQKIHHACGNRLVLMPTKNLTELIAALSICDLFIGADGGAMHLAAALNKNVLGLFENLPFKIKHWYPWRVASQIVYSEVVGEPSVRNIRQEQVISALKNFA